MSNIVQSISEAIETTVETALDEVVKLDFVVDPLKQFDNSRVSANRYGVWPQGVTPNLSVAQSAYVAEQEWRIQLLREYANRNGSDQNQRDVTYALYDDMDTIVKKLHRNNAGCPGVIISIDFASASPVQFIEESDIALLDVFFTVKYSKNLT